LQYLFKGFAKLSVVARSSPLPYGIERLSHGEVTPLEPFHRAGPLLRGTLGLLLRFQPYSLIKNFLEPTISETSLLSIFDGSILAEGQIPKFFYLDSERDTETSSARGSE